MTPSPTAYPTPVPTATPTTYPTPVPTATPTTYPTPHPCDIAADSNDPKHSCDTTNGECYKDGDGWTCGCKNAYECVFGCASPHTGHTCVMTPSPAPDPPP